jgi:hypothetical protein
VTAALAQRPRASIAALETSVTTAIPERQLDRGQIELAIRIASLLTRPIDYIDNAYCRLTGLEPAQLKAMAQHPGFRVPINYAVAVNIGFATADVDAKMLSRLVFSRWSRLAAVIATAPIAEVAQVAWMLAAAVLSKRIRGLVLKGDRDRAHETLGADGFAMATHEAPVLHPSLHELDAAAHNEAFFTDDSGASGSQNRILELGYQVIGRFFDASEPFLGLLFSLRLPPTVRYAEREQYIRRFEKTHCEQLVKLIRRRQQSWSDIIG